MCHRVDKDLHGSQCNRHSFQSWLETGLVILYGTRAYCKAKKKKKTQNSYCWQLQTETKHLDSGRKLHIVSGETKN